MTILHRINAGVVAVALGSSLFATLAVAAPASAENQCASNHNLAHVDRRLDGAIDQLQHDDHDYDGHRVSAIRELSGARQELRAAEQYAVQRYHEYPGCYTAYGADGGSDVPWGLRGQGGSNGDIWGVRRWVADLDGQLNNDDRDYGGHKAAAMRRLGAAEGQMLAAERFARNHGY